MITHRFFCFVGGGSFVLALSLTGCGPSKTEGEARERARLELEEKSSREADLANKAISGMNQKLGRKPPDLNLGVPPEKKVTPVSQPEHKP